MILYVMSGASASDYPEIIKPTIVTDRIVAARAWADWVLDAIGYPNDDPDAEDVEQVERMRDSFIADATQDHIQWTVNNEGPVDEMLTYELYAVAVPNVGPIYQRRKR